MSYVITALLLVVIYFLEKIASVDATALSLLESRLEEHERRLVNLADDVYELEGE